jgi:sialidase-1
MKKYYILTIIMLLVGLQLIAQKIPPTNQLDQLEYTITLSSNQKEYLHQIKSLLQESILKNKWNIIITEQYIEYADLKIILNSQKEYTSISFFTEEEQKCKHIISSKNSNKTINQITQFIKQYFYSGIPPTYSTVFEKEKDGYFEYRIPSVITLPSQRIIAIAEAREEGKTDCEKNDIVLKYSDNNGKNWSPIIVAAEAGEASLNNPTTIFIEELNRILVLFQEYPPATTEALTETGLTGKRITRFHYVYSDDNGITWSNKQEITETAKLPEATGYASGPGIGIRVVSGPDKGRILIPMNVSGSSNGWFNYLIASDDLGKNWKILPGKSMYGTNESQIIQLSDSSFLINARSHRYDKNDKTTPTEWNPWNFDKLPHYRASIIVSINKDQTKWFPTKICTNLPDPHCQGAIYRYSGLKNGEISRILFTNPASQISYPSNPLKRATPPARINGTIRLSYNNGKTWSWSKRIYGNRFTEFQYSVLTRLNSGKIGCLFETGSKIKFAVLDMQWLSSGEDSGK